MRKLQGTPSHLLQQWHPWPAGRSMRASRCSTAGELSPWEEKHCTSECLRARTSSPPAPNLLPSDGELYIWTYSFHSFSFEWSHRLRLKLFIQSFISYSIGKASNKSVGCTVFMPLCFQFQGVGGSAVGTVHCWHRDYQGPEPSLGDGYTGFLLFKLPFPELVSSLPHCVLAPIPLPRASWIARLQWRPHSAPRHHTQQCHLAIPLRTLTLWLSVDTWDSQRQWRLRMLFS